MPHRRDVRPHHPQGRRPPEGRPVTDETIDQRPLPYDRGAERSVLGSMLLSREAIAEVVEIIDSTKMHQPGHQIVFEAIVEVFAKGEPTDPISITNHLREQGLLGKAGGSVDVHDLLNYVATTSNAAHHAEIVRDCAIRRDMIKAGAAITSLGYSGRDATASLEAAAAEIAAITAIENDQDSAPIGDDFEDFLGELEELARNGKAMGVPTGFTDLDSLLNGLHPGQIIIIAGRPALGKSTLAVDFLRACSIEHGRPSILFSLEMSRREVQARITSAEARVGLHHIRSGTMTDDDWLRIGRRAAAIADAPFVIDAGSNQTVARIKAKCRRLKQQSGLDLVVIDYLQLLTSGTGRRDNRQLEVSDMSRHLKLMAKELEVPVVVLAQLNRESEKRQDKKPTKADLRESGSLEQDADVVILLHREDAHEKASPRAGETDLIVDKHRNGPTATITVAAQLHYSRFVDMAQT
ncbi:replicative DNA helicase [Streptomyces turgidiscabies]|uniref:replicative DNA helicase n=1 Tax=Streptomyces turgidiscabies TaxID=85558 RepID=UPI0038F71446